ncbi:hypothetical protein NP233_g2526 [Leucocoprinus birnbaumii]|uniref:Nephrocystin 3-like N-terminal domain-containing protein n=1 Tax=Leucocoprinus birnbaumii TaxID=56174 RepID=A0AAD5W0K5_9AGAR|nr:hypothetical protein NP233_g2526 [Leucocoprinus birnbaumii]
MNFFSHSSNFVVRDCPIIIHSSSDGNSGSNGIDVLFNAALHDAAYDSLDRYPPPRCHPGTRVQYIEDILQFVLPARAPELLESLFWMYGPAGVGKTAVAQTCVEKIKERRHPCASFFFSISGRSGHIRFFPTLAYQLATEFPEYQTLLDAKLRRDRSLINKAMSFQFQSLIIDPWLELQANGQGSTRAFGDRIPIFVDGPDECGDPEAQRAIIELVAGSIARHKSLPFCWLFFSRPETHITSTFNLAEIKILCRQAVLPISRDCNGEIELYLRAGFQNILRRGNFESVVPQPWPTEEQIQQLVVAADGLFIFGVTTLRFINNARWLEPQEPLQIVLENIAGSQANLSGSSPSSDHSPFAELDKLYRMIMMRIPTSLLHHIRLLLRVLCFRAEADMGYAGAVMGAVIAGNVLNLSAGQLRGVCNQLSAVIHFEHQDKPLDPPEGSDSTISYLSIRSLLGKRVNALRNSVFRQLGGSISFYHKSFYDFLSDETRSVEYSYKSSGAHDELLHHYLKRHLHFDSSYCFEETELKLPEGIESSAHCLSHSSTTEFSNSVVQATTHSFLYRQCMWLGCSPFVSLELRKALASCDFRKALCVQTTLFPKLRVWMNSLLGTHGYSKFIYGTRIFGTTQASYVKSNLDGFRQRIELLREADVIQREEQQPALLRLTREGCETDLYQIGRGSSSTFWYWEINHANGFYRDFETMDINQGMKFFLDEDFSLWPQ